MSDIKITEVNCRSVLNRSRIPGIDYTLNPYTGCLHGCVYCYARFMTRFSKCGLPWRKFCEVKVNTDAVLAKQLLKAKKGRVSLSTVTDPYQGPERKYQLTRASLIRLAEAGFPVSILTKSDLVQRDLDVLKSFNRESCDVGFSLISPDDAVRAAFEPGAPAIQSRFEAIKTLHQAGIRTWVFLAPVLPVITEKGLPELAESISGFADRVLVDGLNIKCGNWQGINTILSARYPSQLAEWRAALFSEKKKGSYYSCLAGRIRICFARKGIRVEFC